MVLKPGPSGRTNPSLVASVIIASHGAVIVANEGVCEVLSVIEHPFTAAVKCTD